MSEYKAGDYVWWRDLGREWPAVVDRPTRNGHTLRVIVGSTFDGKRITRSARIADLRPRPSLEQQSIEARALATNQGKE